MPDPRSTAIPPAPGAETGDDEVRALKDAVGAIRKRVDAMGKRDDRHDDRRDDKRDDDRHDAPVDMSEIASMLRVILRHLGEDGEGDEPEAESDDDRRGDRKRPDDKDMPPRRLASDDDDRRRDTRADAMRRKLAALEEGNANLIARLSRSRSDEEIDRLSELQSEWDRVAMAHGVRASRPMDGEKPSTYDRRHARRFQEFSDKWKNADLSNAPRDIMAVASPEIRHDALEAAYRPAPGGGGVLREIKKRDRTGREISEFVGSLDWMNQFRSPTYRARINRPPDRPYND